jgi:hypothetical protein
MCLRAKALESMPREARLVAVLGFADPSELENKKSATEV